MPKVSVIIPTFNCAKYILNTIDSVLVQTYSDIEIIVIDDGSLDKTKEVLKKYYNKIRYLYQANSGPAAARNLGIRKSHGTYIAFLDADDVFMPEKIERQVRCLEENTSLGLVYCDACTSYEDGTKIGSINAERRAYSGHVFDKLFLDCFILTPTVMIRKECFNKIGYFNECLKRSEDYEFYLRIAKEYEIGYLNEVMVCINRVREDRLTADIEALYNADISTLLSIIDKYQEYFKDKSTLIHKRFDQLGFDGGWQLFNRGQYASARNKFFISIRHNKLNIRAYIYLLFTFFDPKSIKNLKWLKNKLFANKIMNTV